MDNPSSILQQIETLIDEEQAKSSTNSPHTLETMSPALNALVNSPRRGSKKNTPTSNISLLNAINPPQLNLNSEKLSREEVLEQRKKRQAEKKAAKALRKQQAKARALEKANQKTKTKAKSKIKAAIDNNIGSSSFQMQTATSLDALLHRYRSCYLISLNTCQKGS